MSSETRTMVIRAAGILIILLGLGAALLPLAGDVPARTVIGSLLIAAGILEIAAFAARRVHHVAGAVAAAATLLAGLRLAVDPGANYFTVLNFVILWLVVHSAAFVFLARATPRPECAWIYFAAAVDFLLAVALLAGLPIAILVRGIFGPTPEISASFAWVFAATFVATGILLIAAGRTEANERSPRPNSASAFPL